jgi:hypothetical protein
MEAWETIMAAAVQKLPAPVVLSLALRCGAIPNPGGGFLLE